MSLQVGLSPLPPAVASCVVMGPWFLNDWQRVEQTLSVDMGHEEEAMEIWG